MKLAALALQTPLAAVVAAQVTPTALEGAPGWVVTFLFGAWVAITYLDKVGKLWGQGGRARVEFGTDDRRKLGQVHGSMFHRDLDGFERFPSMVKTIKDVAEHMEEHNLKAEECLQEVKRNGELMRELQRTNGASRHE